MSMLAERKSRVKWALNPRGNLWSQDTNKFGQRMLEKMGWKVGRGLGANEQGITEHIRLAHKNDNKCIGYKENGEKWVEQQSEFENFLSELTTAHNIESSLKDEKETESLEKKSRSSKARVHYQKFTRGKDLSNYSSKDLSCILGIKEESGVNIEDTNDDDPKDASESHSGQSNNLYGVKTLYGGNMNDYFAKIKNKINMQSENCDEPISGLTEADNHEYNDSEKSSKKKQKSKANREIEINEENNNDEGSVLPLSIIDHVDCLDSQRKKKNRKNITENIPLSGNSNITECDKELTCHDDYLNNEHGVDNSDSQTKKKRKKKINQEISLKQEMENVETITEDLRVAELENHKKKNKRKTVCNLRENGIEPSVCKSVDSNSSKKRKMAINNGYTYGNGVITTVQETSIDMTASKAIEGAQENEYFNNDCGNNDSIVTDENESNIRKRKRKKKVMEEENNVLEVQICKKRRKNSLEIPEECEESNQDSRKQKSNTDSESKLHNRKSDAFEVNERDENSERKKKRKKKSLQPDLQNENIQNTEISLRSSSPRSNSDEGNELYSKMDDDHQISELSGNGRKEKKKKKRTVHTNSHHVSPQNSEVILNSVCLDSSSVAANELDNIMDGNQISDPTGDNERKEKGKKKRTKTKSHKENLQNASSVEVNELGNKMDDDQVDALNENSERKEKKKKKKRTVSSHQEIPGSAEVSLHSQCPGSNSDDANEIDKKVDGDQVSEYSERKEKKKKKKRTLQIETTDENKQKTEAKLHSPRNDKVEESEVDNKINNEHQVSKVKEKKKKKRTVSFHQENSGSCEVSLHSRCPDSNSDKANEIEKKVDSDQVSEHSERKEKKKKKRTFQFETSEVDNKINDEHQVSDKNNKLKKKKREVSTKPDPKETENSADIFQSGESGNSLDQRQNIYSIQNEQISKFKLLVDPKSVKFNGSNLDSIKGYGYS